MTFQNKRLSIILLSIVTLLSIPLIAMQFTKAVDWNMTDFVIMGGLLIGTGLVCEFIMRSVKKVGYRIAICGAVLLIFLLIWAELAVGIFGTPFAGS